MLVGNTANIPIIPEQTKTPDLRKTAINPDYWYPVARSNALKKGKMIAITFSGDPVVIARTASGTLFALENRCAHRQVPLVNGVLNGEHLKCGYHCWTYDRTGKCISVPYLDSEQPMPKGVKAYPCREAYGLIFIFPGDASKSETSNFPEIPSHDDPHYKTRYLDREVTCHYSFMHENLMDMNHQFLHRRLMGGIKTVLLDLRQGDGWVETDYTFKRVVGKQHVGEKLILKRWAEPGDTGGDDLMTIRTEYPYQTLKFWTAGSEHPALDLWNVYIPIDREQRINHTYGLMMFRKPAIPGLINLFWPFIIWFTEGIFGEDRWIVELEQKAFDEQGADWNQEIFPVIQSLRKLLINHGIPM